MGLGRVKIRMIDREKVANGLRHCLHYDGSCLDCPYDGPNCQNDVLDDAIAILKEQEAVPVIQREIMHMLFWCCGSCGVAITDGDRFCRNCGREVKWK